MSDWDILNGQMPDGSIYFPLLKIYSGESYLCAIGYLYAERILPKRNMDVDRHDFIVYPKHFEVASMSEVNLQDPEILYKIEAMFVEEMKRRLNVQVVRVKRILCMNGHRHGRKVIKGRTYVAE